MIYLEILLIGLLIIANGFFAAAELAIVTANRFRLKSLADGGRKGAGIALTLAEQPDRFLATVQVGITLVGTFAAAFGGATIVHVLKRPMESVSWLAPESEVLALAIFTVVLTFVQVVVGELLPKRIALVNPTGLACFVAPGMQFLSRAAAPAVWLARRTTDALVSLVPLRPQEEPKVELQEITQLVEAAAGQGVLDPVERHVAIEALHLGDRPVRSVMTPRHEIDAADVETPSEEVLGVVLMSGFSRLPVYEGDLDHIVGYVRAHDVMTLNYMRRSVNLRKLLRPVYYVPEMIRLDRLLVEFRKRRTAFAIVVDERGRTMGLVTQEDVVGELVGEILSPSVVEPNIVPRPDGGWLVEGRTPIEELLQLLNVPSDQAPPKVQTVAGLVLEQLGRMPAVGESTLWQGYQLEVVDLDANRIDKVLVTKTGSAP